MARAWRCGGRAPCEKQGGPNPCYEGRFTFGALQPVSWAAGRARDQEVSLLRAALSERDMRLRDSKSELLGAPRAPAPHPCCHSYDGRHSLLTSSWGCRAG